MDPINESTVSADKNRKLGILFQHGETEDEIKQFRDSRKHLRNELNAVKKGRKAVQIESMNQMHPHYETFQLDRSGTEERVKL